MRKGWALGALLLAAGLAAAGSEAASVPEVDLELVLAVDVSGSIIDEEAHLQREGYRKALTDPRVIRAIQAGRHKQIAVAYVEWASAGLQWLAAGWTLVKDEATARALAERIHSAERRSGRFTSLSGAIDYSVPLFGTAFKGRRRVIDISGDGPNNRGRPVALARDQALARGVSINAIVIMDEKGLPWGLPPVPRLDLYFRKCVIGGPGAFVLVANDFKDFARAIRRKLILEIVGLTPPARPILAADEDFGVPHCDAFLRPDRNPADF